MTKTDQTISSSRANAYPNVGITHTSNHLTFSLMKPFQINIIQFKSYDCNISAFIYLHWRYQGCVRGDIIEEILADHLRFASAS